MRLGVALLVPPRVAEQLDVVRRALGAGGAIHRMAPHLTLVPPVNVAEGRLGEAEAVVRRAAATTRPFAATLGPPATFLPVNPVLHLAVGPGTAVAQVEGLRDRVFVDPLVRDLSLPFVPHVTLVDGGDPERVAAAVGVLADLALDVVFDRVALLREQRDADGVRIWRPLLEAGFGGPVVVARGGLEVVLEVGTALAHDAERWSHAAWDDHDRDEAGDGWSPRLPVAVTARRSGAVVGTVTGAVRDGDARLRRLIVDAAERGEGVGGHLLAAYTAEVVAHGANRLLVRTVAGARAERFFRERGFTGAAVLPRRHRGHDIVALERWLDMGGR